MKTKHFESFINTDLDQHMAIDYDGYRWVAVRQDGDGYKTSLTLTQKDCIKFKERLVAHGWEKVNERASV